MFIAEMNNKSKYGFGTGKYLDSGVNINPFVMKILGKIPGQGADGDDDWINWIKINILCFIFFHLYF